MDRHRALAPLITLLAIATGLTLFATGWALASPAVADPRPLAADQVVHNFYEAINFGVRTGDTTLLDSVVLEDADIHGGPSTFAPGRAALTRYVKSLHATAPQLELSVVNIVSAGDRSLVDVAIENTNEEHLGSPISNTSLWGEIDALLVSDHKVIEYWSGANGMAMLEPLAQAPFPETNTDRAVELDRLSILPGESFVAEGADESRWLYVESGRATISTTPVDMAPSIWAQVPDLVKRPLVAGDLIPVPIWRRTELRNDSREPANLLVLTVGFTTRGTPRLDPAYPQGQSTTYAGQKSQSWWAGAQVRADGEATVTSLAGNMKTMLPANGGNVAIAKATLAPGSAIAFDELNGPYLIAGNAGAFVLSTAVRDLDELHVFRHLDGGQGAHLDPGTVASISNVEEEQVVVTIVAILPAEA